VHVEQLLGEAAVLQHRCGLGGKVVLARDLLPETVQQRRRQPERSKRVRLVGTSNPVVNLARGHKLDRATREQQGFPTKRLTLHSAGNECDMAVEMIVRLKAKLGKSGRAENQTGDLG
jgi:hypothetical protein